MANIPPRARIELPMERMDRILPPMAKIPSMARIQKSIIRTHSPMVKILPLPRIEHPMVQGTTSYGQDTTTYFQDTTNGQDSTNCYDRTSYGKDTTS